MIAIGSGIRVGEPICSGGGRDGSEGEGEMIIISNDPEEAEQQKKSLTRDNELRTTCDSFDSHNSIAIGRYVRYNSFSFSFSFSLVRYTSVNHHYLVSSSLTLSFNPTSFFFCNPISILPLTHFPLQTAVSPPKRPSVLVLRFVIMCV